MGVAWDLEAGEKVTYSYYDGDVAYDPNYNGSNVNSATGGDPRAVNDYGSDNETEFLLHLIYGMKLLNLISGS